MSSASGNGGYGSENYIHTRYPYLQGDRACQIIKCNPWRTSLQPHPTVIKKMKAYLELEGKLGPKLPPQPDQSRPTQPTNNPCVRKETKATGKMRKLILTKKYKVKVVARPEPIPKTSNTTAQPPLTTPSDPTNSEKNPPEVSTSDSNALHSKTSQFMLAPHDQCYVWQCWPICTFLLGLSRGIVSCILLIIIYIKCTVIHKACLWVPLLERDNMTNIYKIFTFIITIFFYLTSYNTINIIHKCTLNCKVFLIGSSSSMFYSLSNRISFFSCILSFLCLSL